MTGKTILICDDALVVRAELRTMLERHGFTVITADDGDVAAEVASRHPEIDLCIMDYNMPAMNGLEAMHLIRKQEAHTSLPIFILTTESADSLAQDGLEQGATAWIVKPWQEEALLAGITHVIGDL